MKYIAMVILMFLAFNTNAQCQLNESKGEEGVCKYTDYIFMYRDDEVLSISFMKENKEYYVVINYTPANKLELVIEPNHRLLIDTPATDSSTSLALKGESHGFKDEDRYIIIAHYYITKEVLQQMLENFNLIVIQTDQGEKGISIPDSLKQKFKDQISCLLSVK